MIRAADRLSGRVRRLTDSARRVQSVASRPTPPVEIDSGRALPGWVLRLVVVGLLTASIVVLDPPIVARVLVIIFAGVVALRPNASTAAVFVGMTALFWTLFPTPVLSASGFVLLALLGAVWSLSAVLPGAGLRTRVEWAILIRPARRFAIIQLVAQLFLLVGQLIQTRDADSTVLGWTVLTAAIALAIAIWVILPRLSAD